MFSGLKKKIGLKAYKWFCRRTKPQRDVIVFESNGGNNYTGSPKAIYEKMAELGLDRNYRIFYALKDPKHTVIPGHLRKIKYKSMAYFYAFSVASIWVSDSRLSNSIIKKDGVSYIQTWHGTPLKKLALDMDDVAMAGSSNIYRYKANFFDNTQKWDYLLSQNRYSSEIFGRCFAFHKDMLEIGYPRNDILFSKNNKDDIRLLKKKFGLPENKKIILYAPTWRDNDYYGKGNYKFQLKLDFDKLREELSRDYAIIVKYHYLVSSEIDWKPYEGFVYDFGRTDDISELYLISDMMITDYSSVMFDYSLLNRPMFFYCYDLEEYRDSLRGFYFDFEAEAPGPISQTTEELIRDIKNYRPEDYAEKYAAYHEKFNAFDDGHASERIVGLIENIAHGRPGVVSEEAESFQQ